MKRLEHKGPKRDGGKVYRGTSKLSQRCEARQSLSKRATGSAILTSSKTETKVVEQKNHISYSRLIGTFRKNKSTPSVERSAKRRSGTYRGIGDYFISGEDTSHRQRNFRVPYFYSH